MGGNVIKKWSMFIFVFKNDNRYIMQWIKNHFCMKVYSSVLCTDLHIFWGEENIRNTVNQLKLLQLNLSDGGIHKIRWHLISLHYSKMLGCKNASEHLNADHPNPQATISRFCFYYCCFKPFVCFITQKCIYLFIYFNFIDWLLNNNEKWNKLWLVTVHVNQVISFPP